MLLHASRRLSAWLIFDVGRRFTRMRHIVAFGLALSLVSACSSVRRQELMWQPAIVSITARLAMNAFKANGDCEEIVTLEAMMTVPPGDEQRKVSLKPWGPGTWEEGKLYEVEIARELSPRGEELTWMRKRPNKAPEPTPLRVTPRAYARVAPLRAVAHL